MGHVAPETTMPLTPTGERHAAALGQLIERRPSRVETGAVPFGTIEV